MSDCTFRLSSNPELRHLQEIVVNSSKTSNSELMSTVKDLIEQKRFPAKLGVFVAKLILQQRCDEAMSIYVRLLRNCNYNRASVYVEECQWIWASGWRERAFSMIIEAIVKWGIRDARMLGMAMLDFIKKETASERTLRYAYILSQPSDSRPFVEGKTYVENEGERVAFLERLPNFDIINDCYITLCGRIICKGASDIVYDKFLQTTRK